MSRSASTHALITRDQMYSPVSEAYKTLRTNIRFASVGDEIHKIAVTSAAPREGRTTTAINLAITYALEDKQVLLVDADLRRPSIQHAFPHTGDKGLSELLIQNCALGDVITETDIPNLSVLTAGTIPPNPSELLGSERMEVLLNELAERFDMIIVDTPPSLSVADAQIVGALCDGVVLVVNQGKVPLEHVQRVKSNMEHVQARILGAVLNNSNNSKKESYYQNYYGRN